MVSSLSLPASIPTPGNRIRGERGNPGKVTRLDLPEIAQAEAQALIEDVAKLLAGFGYTRSSADSKKDNADPFEEFGEQNTDTARQSMNFSICCKAAVTGIGMSLCGLHRLHGRSGLVGKPDQASLRTVCERRR